MRRLLLSSFFLAVVAVCGSAHAVTLSPYTLTGSVDGYAVSGTLLLDPSHQIVTADITWHDPAGGDPEFTDVIQSEEIPFFGHVLSTITDANGDTLALDYPISGNPVIPLCSNVLICQIQFDSDAASEIALAPNPDDFQAFDSGEITLAPEPSSLLLLGTGALAAAGPARRRLLKR